jgi:hypothetical protein
MVCVTVKREKYFTKTNDYSTSGTKYLVFLARVSLLSILVIGIGIGCFGFDW